MDEVLHGKHVVCEAFLGEAVVVILLLLVYDGFGALLELCGYDYRLGI
jgi:hypothetical protein